MEEVRGFPGMLGSIDCMHWEWKNFPVARKGQSTRGDHGRPTIMLEVVASQDLWIWHAFFGVLGSNNDLNVLNQSPLFTDILQGQAPRVEITINGTQYNKGYYLANGIYPEWDVLKDIMYACIILHNIIVDDERDAYESLFDFNYDDDPADTLIVEVLHRPISDFPTMLQRNAEIRDKNIHRNLQADLVEHIWSKFGNHFN
ncbi:uncharacterized protein LOC133795719 [Humulus lupulus]|uniref:uncharacterized protein LOC133795719 n=1 Tax=Humulus lupulus TaxID=3486 RepID=UPI002B411F4B|nr:uncharacterized protein LOC133795719 [Humulus lupulus]